MTSAPDILKKNGKWMKSEDLLKSIIDEAGCSDRTAYRRIQKAIKEKEIRKIVLPDRGTLYGLSDWPPEASSQTLDLQLIKNVLEVSRHEYRFFKEPTVKEVAIKIGKGPEIVRSILYELTPDTGWREQEMREAKKEAEASINLAGYKKWLQKGDELGKYTLDQIGELNRKAEEEIGMAPPPVVWRAENILKNYPELVSEAKPKEKLQGRVSGIIPMGLDPWPKETNRIWQQVFHEKAPKSGRTSRWIMQL